MRLTQLARLAAAVLAALLVLVLANHDSHGETTPRYHDYVSIGDSFTAAPFVPLNDVAYGCLRSTNNYPHQVASALQIDRLQDNSCTGANTDDLTERQLTARGMSVHPQQTGLSRATDLVTVSLGFNNLHLYARMNTLCRQTTRVCPLYDERSTLYAIVQQVRDALVRTLARVHELAPHARVLLVSYPRLLPPTGSCSKLPHFRPRDRATYRSVNYQLVQQMRAAATEAKVEFIDYYHYSYGHDICARHPWVMGKVGNRYRAAALHPLAAGERAVARLVVAALRHPPPARG